MLLAKLSKDFLKTSKVLVKYPLIQITLTSIFTALYSISFYNCVDIVFNDFILPLLTKFFRGVKLKMSGLFGGSSSNNLDTSPNPSSNPTPPNPNSTPITSDKPDSEKKKKNNPALHKKKKRLKKKESDKEVMDRKLDKLRKACDKLCDIGGNHNKNAELQGTLKEFSDKYYKWLPSDVKKEVNSMQKAFRDKGLTADKGYNSAHSVKNY